MGRRTAGAALTVVAVLLTVTVSSTVPSKAAKAAKAPVLAVWVVPATSRVPPWAAAGSRSAAQVEAARGETESFQLVLRGPGRALTDARVRVSPLLREGGGGRIGGRHVALFREHYVRVTRHSPAWSGPPLRWGWFPDALVPFVDPVTGRPPRAGARYRAQPVTIAAGRTQPVWVDVTVPRRAAAGVYRGTWTATTTQGRRSGTVAMRVRDVTLPVVPSSASRFGIRRPANRWRAVEELLLRYRVQPAPVPTSHEVALRPAGLTTTALGFSGGADALDCTMAGPPPVETLRAAVATHDPSLRLYDYSADEISDCPGLTDVLAAWGRALHEVGVEHLVTVRPRADLLDDGTGRPVVDIWPLLPWQLRDLDPALRSAVLASGGEFWSYQALVQGRRTPSWQLDFPVLNYRVLGGFLNASQGVTGLLYWAVDEWQRDPWVDPTYRYPGSCCYAGDGTLVYPGRPAGVVGVVPSVRLAMVRDGMDDYDYVTLLRQRGLGDQAQQVVAAAASSWSRWSADARVLTGVRSRLLDLLEATAPRMAARQSLR